MNKWIFCENQINHNFELLKMDFEWQSNFEICENEPRQNAQNRHFQKLMLAKINDPLFRCLTDIGG